MEGTVITVGTFDGLHLGHQAILQRLRTIACEKRLSGIAYTFAFPPRHVSQHQTKEGHAPPSLLLPQSAKRKLLEQYVDRVEQADFVSVRNCSARQFIRNVLLAQFAVRAIVVGEAFRFGRDREGNVPLLRQFGKDHKLCVVTVPTVMTDHAPVSSSRIRGLVEAGQVQEARLLLSRPPLLVGKVVARIDDVTPVLRDARCSDDTIPGRGIYRSARRPPPRW